MPPIKRPTLADVAGRAKLSITATSMILNNKPGTRLSADAAARVRKAAAELGYRPNVNARGLRTAKTDTIGFISDKVAAGGPASGLIRGALETAEQMGHVLLVLETEGDHRRERRALGAVLDRQVDGVIFATARARELDIPALPADVRAVMLNATNKGVPLKVLPDEVAGGAAAAAAVAEAGHREGIILVGIKPSLVMSGNPLYSANVANRLAGLRAGLSSAGLKFDAELVVNDWNPREGHAALAAYLRSGNHPRCIITLNDSLAFGSYQALAEAGLSVPQDTSVVSFDNDDMAEFLRPGLTTVALPYDHMGAAAVRLILSGKPSSEELVPMPLIRRGSLAERLRSK